MTKELAMQHLADHGIFEGNHKLHTNEITDIMVAFAEAKTIAGIELALKKAEEILQAEWVERSVIRDVTELDPVAILSELKNDIKEG